MYTKKFLLDSFSHHHHFFFFFFEKMELPLCGLVFGVVGFFWSVVSRSILGFVSAFHGFFLSDKLLHVLDYNHFLCRVVK